MGTSSKFLITLQTRILTIKIRSIHVGDKFRLLQESQGQSLKAIMTPNVMKYNINEQNQIV